MSVDEAVTRGRAALRAGRWDEARAALESAAKEDETPEVLDGLAEVRAWQGDYTAAVELRQRAFAGFRARGDTRYPALLAAYYLAFDYAAVYGNFAAANGWLERGKRLAEVSGDCPERGWVQLACVLATDDIDEKERHIAAAIDIARRFGDTDLEFDALAYSGVCRVERGQIAEGMRKLDEAAAAAQGGEVQGFTAAGEIYCKMLLACELALDVRRAEQWADAANLLARRAGVAWASAICRMYYGGILMAAGRWAEAENEFTRSVAIYDRGHRALRSGAVVRLADLRVRQGRIDEAERLLAGYEHDGYAVRPMARLHLARGEVDIAATLLRRHINQCSDGVRVLQAPVLGLLAEVEVAAGRLHEAREIAAQLAALAAQTPLPLLRALAEFTAGMVDSEGALVHFEAALAGFIEAGLPLEEARTRLYLAALLTETNPEVAIAEARTALTAFDRLGAERDSDAAAALLRSLGARGRTGPKHVGLLSKREQEVLQLLALGLSNPEIAARLFISRKTASNHVSNVLAKLGLRNRTEAAVYLSQADPRTPDAPDRSLGH